MSNYYRVQKTRITPFGTGKESLSGSAAKNPKQKTRLQREIDDTDRQIDQLVHELYGLTEVEIRIVETNNGSK